MIKWRCIHINGGRRNRRYAVEDENTKKFFTVSQLYKYYTYSDRDYFTPYGLSLFYRKHYGMDFHPVEIKDLFLEKLVKTGVLYKTQIKKNCVGYRFKSQSEINSIVCEVSAND